MRKMELQPAQPAVSGTTNERAAAVELHKSVLFGPFDLQLEDEMSAASSTQLCMESSICCSSLCELPTRNNSLTTVSSNFPIMARIESCHTWPAGTVAVAAAAAAAAATATATGCYPQSANDAQGNMAAALNLLEPDESKVFDVEAQAMAAAAAAATPKGGDSPKTSWC